MSVSVMLTASQALFLLLLVSGLTAQEQEPVRNPRTSPADIAAGAKTFRSHCSPCHGLNGEGGRGPNLASGRFFHANSDLDLLNIISDGIPGTEMPGLFYSPDRVWQVVAYIRSLNAPAAADTEGDARRGALLFQKHGCLQCHRVGGAGGRLGPDLSAIGQVRSPQHLRQSLIDPSADVRQGYWVVSGQEPNGRRYEGFLMNEDTYTVQFLGFDERLYSLRKSDLRDYKVAKVSKMPSFKDKLQESELRDLVAYLSSLRPQGGSR